MATKAMKTAERTLANIFSLGCTGKKRLDNSGRRFERNEVSLGQGLSRKSQYEKYAVRALMSFKPLPLKFVIRSKIGRSFYKRLWKGIGEVIHQRALTPCLSLTKHA